MYNLFYYDNDNSVKNAKAKCYATSIIAHMCIHMNILFIYYKYM